MDNNDMNAALGEELTRLVAESTDVQEVPAVEDPFESNELELAPDDPDDGQVLIEVDPEEAVAAVEEASAIADERQTRAASSERAARTSIFDSTGEKVRGTFRGPSVHVTPMGERLGFDTFAMEVARDLETLARAAQSYSKRTLTGLALTGKVGRVSVEGDHVCAWVRYGTVDVMIPHEQFRAWAPGETIASISRRMNQYIGAEIQYYVLHVDNENVLAVGDRLAVLRHETLVNWLTPDRRTGEYQVREGYEYEGVIDRVASTYLTVTVMGYTADIPVQDVLWDFTSDLRNYKYAGSDERAFEPGKHIGVCVKEIKRTQENGRVGLTATLSIKDTASSRARREHAFRHFRAHRSREIGTVQGYSQKTGNVYVTTAYDGLTVLCKPVTEFTPPARGSKVSIRITRVDNEKLLLYGDILYVLD